MDMSLSKVQEIVKDSEARHAGIHGVAKNQMQFRRVSNKEKEDMKLTFAKMDFCMLQF